METLRNQGFVMHLAIGSIISEQGFEAFKNFLEKNNHKEDQDNNDEIPLEQLGIEPKENKYKILGEFKVGDSKTSTDN